MRIHPDDLLLQEYLERPEEHPLRLADHVDRCEYCAGRAERLRPRLAAGRPAGQAGAGNLLSWQAAPPDYGPALERSERTFDRLFLDHRREQEEAKLLLDELLTHPPPRQEILVVNSRRFQTWGLFELLTGRSHAEAISDAARGEQLARLALKLSAELDTAHYGATQIADVRARAWAYIANALRLRFELQRADEAFAVAFAHLRTGTGDLFERALLFDLKASLLRDQMRLDEAQRMLQRAVSIFHSIGDPARAGRSLVNLSTTYEHMGRPAGSIRALEEAKRSLVTVDDPHLQFCVRHNLATNLVSAGRVLEATRLLAQSRHFYRHFRAPWADHRETWLQARIAHAQGQVREAESGLAGARQGFAEAGLHYDAALVGIDLAGLYARQARRQDLRRLTRQLLPTLSSQHLEARLRASIDGIDTTDAAGG